MRPFSRTGYDEQCWAAVTTLGLDPGWLSDNFLLMMRQAAERDGGVAVELAAAVEQMTPGIRAKAALQAIVDTMHSQWKENEANAIVHYGRS